MTKKDNTELKYPENNDALMTLMRRLPAECGHATATILTLLSAGVRVTWLDVEQQWPLLKKGDPIGYYLATVVQRDGAVTLDTLDRLTDIIESGQKQHFGLRRPPLCPETLGLTVHLSPWVQRWRSCLSGRPCNSANGTMYDDLVRSHTRIFQRMHGLDETGIVGPAEWASVIMTDINAQLASGSVKIAWEPVR